MFLVRSGAIEGYEKLVTELGGNPVQLMQDVGLNQTQFRNPNTYISYSRLAELLEITASACNRPLFGLLLARRQTSSVLGDLPVILSQHVTVRKALEDTDRYLYLHARGVKLQQQTRGDNLELGLAFEISSPRGLDQLIQMSTGHLADFTAELLNIDKYSLPLFLRQHAPGHSAQRPEQPFYTRIQFNADNNCIRIPKRWLDRKSHRNEQAIREHFADYLRRLQQRYPDNLQDQVRDLVGRILPGGECSGERVAAALGLHPRVLQKKLQQQGTSYSKLLRETRMEIAEQHLRHKTMGITDLALNLGYAEVSVFSRNFKQWTGLSPRQWQSEKNL